MTFKLPPAAFLALQVPAIDVRSPGEFAQGHIPGMVSMPLFTDEERAAVGTFYKQQGSTPAYELGLEYVGPKMADWSRAGRRLAGEADRLRVHCWRGGQRSASMAWLLRGAGLEVWTLEGGYKAYRQHVLGTFDTWSGQVQVLSGRTGSGKTHILHALRDLGEQIIDLEALAHHKGSAFGAIGEKPQPTVEQFENHLYDALMQTDPNRRVWIEAESRSIGRVFIPDGFWHTMQNAPVANITIPNDARIQNLLHDYVLEHTELLRASFLKIEKKLGGLQLKQALSALDAGDFASAATIALGYYDKTYQHCLDNRTAPQVTQLEFDTGDPVTIAKTLAGL
jgi:tRNA 2-selenouridine synthase